MKSDKPKLLIFTDWYLPGYQAGGPVRSIANLAIDLAGRFDISIVCRDRDYLSTNPYPNIPANEWVHRPEARVMYLDQKHQNYSKIKSILAAFPTETPVHVNGMFSPVFSVFPIKAALALKRRHIISPRGMLAPNALALKGTKKKLFLAALKRLGWYRKAEFHATSAEEVRSIQTVLGIDSARVSLIPNIPGSPVATVRTQKRAKRLRILQVARIAPEKNNLFAIQILRDIPPQVEVEFKLVGPVYDQSYFEMCKIEAAALPGHLRVEFAGSATPVEIEKLYGHFDLFFLPSLGENYGHAIIDALLHGCPVLISDRTPWRDLQGLQVGADIALEDKVGFVNFICNLANMNEADYCGTYSHIASSAATLMDRPDMIENYCRLFHE